MNVNQLAMYGAWAIIVIFAFFGILFLAVTFLSREKTEKVKEAPVEQSFFSSAGVKTNADGSAGAANTFAFPASRPVPVNPAPGQLPPTIRSRPLSPQEILSSISDDETSLEALQQRPTPAPAPAKAPLNIPPRDEKA
jgi:hypothetical protein